MDVNKIKQTPKNRVRVIQNQIDRLEARLAALYRQSNRLSQVRLSIFIIGVIAVGAAFWFVRGWLVGLISLLVWLAIFGVSIFVHQRLETTILKYQIWLQMKSTQIARLNLDWEAIPPASIGRAAAEHPFARDLDLTGDRSLHRLLDVCVSREGSERLRDWLFEPESNLESEEKRSSPQQTHLNEPSNFVLLYLPENGGSVP